MINWSLKNQGGSKKFPRFNENKNKSTICQHLQDTAKAVRRGEFIAMTAYIKKLDRTQINNINYIPQALRQTTQSNPKVSRWKEIIKRQK
jgi:cytochrome c553